MRNSPMPKPAADEISGILADDYCIGSAQIDSILKKHGVRGNDDALQSRYRKAMAQRYMAGFRDDEGRREILAVHDDAGEIEYIVLDACNDKNKLKRIEHKLERMKAGLDNSAIKVRRRRGFLGRFSRRRT